MPMEKSALEKLIRDGIPSATVRIEDLRGDGEHYEAYITSPSFRGMSRVQQHQVVYAALKGCVGRELHALGLHTSAEETAKA